MRTLRRWLSRLLGRDTVRVPRQTTWAYCPGCHIDLCSNPNTTFVEAADGATTMFRCPCGESSRWDFNAPVPILLSSWRLVRPTVRVRVH